MKKLLKETAYNAIIGFVLFLLAAAIFLFWPYEFDVGPVPPRDAIAESKTLVVGDSWAAYVPESLFSSPIDRCAVR